MYIFEMVITWERERLCRIRRLYSQSERYSFPIQPSGKLLWDVLMSPLACNDWASFLLSFLVLRKPFVPIFLRLDFHDLRTSKLKKSFHVFLVRVIIEKWEVYDSFLDTVSKEFLRILSKRIVQSRIDLIPGNFLVTKSQWAMCASQQSGLDTITTR